MKTRMLRLAMTAFFMLLVLQSGCFAADGDEYAGTWRDAKSNNNNNSLIITRSGDYFIIDDGNQKINAVYSAGALKVPGRMGIVLATYDKDTATLKYLSDKEYKLPGQITKAAATPSLRPVKKVAALPALMGPPVPPVRLKPLENGREIAKQLLEELRLLDSAIDQWAIENNKTTGEKATADDLKAYLKIGSHLYNALADENGPKDPLGNDYGPFVVDQIPKVNPTSFAALSDVADSNFWSPYK